MIEPIKTINRAWGKFDLLEHSSVGPMQYWIKMLYVLPEKSLSTQKHIHRSESWLILQGEGKYQLDKSNMPISVGQGLHIPRRRIHSITNVSTRIPLIILETAVGELVDEEDILRFD